MNDEEKRINKNQCPYCINSFIDCELTPDNDLSYMTVGEVAKSYCAYIRSGNGKPTSLIVSHWSEGGQRSVDIALYKMKFCPECGRKLVENQIDVKGA